MLQVIQPCLDVRNFDLCGDLLACCHPDSRCRVAFETVSRRFSREPSPCIPLTETHPAIKCVQEIPLSALSALSALPLHLVRLELSNTVWGFTTLQHGDPGPFARMVMHQLQGLGLKKVFTETVLLFCTFPWFSQISAGLPPEGLAVCAWALVELHCHDGTVLNAIAEAAKEQVPCGKSVSKLQVTKVFRNGTR